MLAPPNSAGVAARPQHGFSLIEVLVALLVLSVGLLGLAMLQIEGLKHNTDAYYRTQATVLAYDIIDRMRANSDAAKNGDYVSTGVPAEETCGDSPSGCGSPAALADYDLHHWYTQLKAALPIDDADPPTITMSGNQITVTVKWKERGISKSRAWVIEL